ncbi:non-specific serine/threonine protein kinase [Malassezia vespertilionis]|uniref:Snf12p n=1 Tax=Malassezia vespertilionis TaxID=2020962 RepID=A0A2N1J8J0_9BASI|nr:non-specific serine/threonine protein kinase [Malassezia vespertilionis]PKI82881.1 Snf12p [Malassezia vespertilionis]WFD08237.1 non-specific serine/threonine protein kinase [Malassezia vespertilionis]
MYNANPAAQQGAYARQAGAQAPTATATQAQQAQMQAQRIRSRNYYDILVGEGFRGLKRDRPTDRSLPPALKRQVKESALYTDLQRIERNLDWTMARKRAELMDSMGKPPKVKRTLRIFLSNTCANQPFQVVAKAEEGDDAPAADAEDDEASTAQLDEKKTQDADEQVPSWTMRIEGRLLDPSFRSRAGAALSAHATANRIGAHKFSNLIKSIVVEFSRDTTEHADAGQGDIVEWHRPAPSVAPQPPIPGSGGSTATENPLIHSAEPALDGFEIKRMGSVPVKAKIVIYPLYTPERYSVAEPLAQLLDVREETRAGVLNALWGYIKSKRLLDEHDHRVVRLDKPLQALFCTPTINFHHIPEVLHRFLHPPQPIVLEYYVRTDKAENKHPTAFDIELEMDDWAVRTKQHNVLARFDANSTLNNEIAQLDEQIAQAALTIRNRAAARQFFTAFAKNPQQHLHTWIASQARDLDTLLGTSHIGRGADGTAGCVGDFSEEEMRRSSTFHGPWVGEAVIVAESQRLAERMQELQAGKARSAHAS